LKYKFTIFFAFLVCDALQNFVSLRLPGQPKKVMELIEHYEQTKRGLFSGAIGYVRPGGNFDFNVVIRSILYNEANKYLSFQAGGGITYNSEPALEYEESLLKVKAMMKVLE